MGSAWLNSGSIGPYSGQGFGSSRKFSDGVWSKRQGTRLLTETVWVRIPGRQPFSAGVAQVAERRFRKPQVATSIVASSPISPRRSAFFLGRYQGSGGRASGPGEPITLAVRLSKILAPSVNGRHRGSHPRNVGSTPTGAANARLVYRYDGALVKRKTRFDSEVEPQGV